MSDKELDRGEVLSRVARDEIGLGKAGELLAVSYRQAKRLWKRYREGGPAALRHGNAGRASNRAKPAADRERALAKVRERYADFGPTLAAEHLASEHGLIVDHETLRRWMREAGLWKRRRKRAEHRSRRQAKAHRGELLQLDGSHHRWLEERGEKGCLLTLVDDATGRTLSLFAAQETTWAAADLLEHWVRRHGVPRAIYADYLQVYQRQPNGREQLEGVEPETQFGRMCRKLGITLIGAGSPQAKGRVERNHSTHQDRLVKKMRLSGICDYEAANGYLDEYLADHNSRFEREPAAGADLHRPLPEGLDLRRVFCLESERTVSRDLVVRYENRWLQLRVRRNQAVGPGARVTVQQWRDGSLHVGDEDGEIEFEELAVAPKKATAKPRVKAQPALVKPAVNHPWRQIPAVKRQWQSG